MIKNIYIHIKKTGLEEVVKYFSVDFNPIIDIHK